MNQLTSRRKLTDPKDVIFQTVTRGMWDRLCQYTAEGVLLDRALASIDIRMSVFRGVMREDLAAREQLETARNDWDSRNWPETLIQIICGGVAMGESVSQLALDECFSETGFQHLRLRDDYVNGMYMKAKRIAAEGMIDQILAMSDDDSQDMAFDARGGDKPNTARVQRSRLMTDNRKWLAGKLIKEIYGEHQIIEADVSLVVDHAARLEEARIRKETGIRANHARLANEPIEGQIVAPVGLLD